MNSESGIEPNELPIVTVFGAGIAGLTAAHELVERGFTVQVVEPQESDFEEYDCAVGGLAANQFTRVRAPISELHPWLLEPGAADNLRLVQQFRNASKIEQTNKRFPLRQRIRFNKRMHGPKERRNWPEPSYDFVAPTPREPGGKIPSDWRDYWDEQGVVNWKKLHDVLEIIRDAAEHYMELYFPELAARLTLGTAPTDEEWEHRAPFSPIQDDATLARSFVARETLLVRVVGYTDTDGTADDNRRLAYEWAKQVKEELVSLNNRDPIDYRVWNLDQQLEVVVRGSVNSRYDQSTPIGRSRSNRVEFEIVEQVIPGEHGFRFFPTFYRHLFDTMRRTPILDAHGAGTGSTAFDQLVPTPGALLAQDDGKGPQPVEVRRLRSMRELDETLKILGDQIGFTPKDLLGLQYYMLRYLLSGPTRRLHEAEPKNLLQYIVGDHPEKKRFSPAALDFINRAPRALAAMSASESDARMQLDITAQLMVVPPAENITADMTLNGPTSTAWLDHWKTYLKAQGVKFFVGRITSLQLLDNRFVPGVEGPDSLDEPRPEDANDPYRCPRSGGDIDNHRFVLALPFQRASDLIWAAYHSVVIGDKPPVFSGPFRQLVEFDRRSSRRDDYDREARAPIRDRATGKPQVHYPLRTISGLQYFFPQEYRFGKGNVYFVSAPWALTSISQFAYWRQRIRPVGPFLGQISVDVGDWHAVHPPGQDETNVQARGNTAWYSSRQEIAENVWEQINRGLATVEAQSIVPPRYFHIDRNIVFDEAAPSGFQGSALLQISPPHEAARSAGIQNVLTFRVSFDKWRRYEGKDETRVLPVPPEITTGQALADHINKHCGRSLYAFVDRNNASQVLVSPIVRSNRIVAAFRGVSNTHSDTDSYTDSYTRETKETSHYIYVDGKRDSLTFTLPVTNRGKRLDALQDAVAGFAPQDAVAASAPKINVRPLDQYNRTFELKRDDGEEFTLTFASWEGGWEVVDGPRLDVRTSPHNIRLMNAMDPAPGWIWSAAIRSNAVLRLPIEEYGDDVPNRLQPGRLYGVAVGVGVGHIDQQFKYEAAEGDAATDVRNALVTLLQQQAGDRVLAQPLGDRGIILSPVARVHKATMNILGRSDQVFHIRIDDHSIAMDGNGKDETELRDAVVVAIRDGVGGIIVVEPVAERSLSLVPSPLPNVSPDFTVAVLNADRAIELGSAPALTVEVKNLYIEPSEGFVVLRNDAEFLINIPGQWQWRPGLCRGEAAAAVPKDPDYAQLAGFGARGTEIFYGHGNCRPLEHWVAAGTYMATYTRITTMEAANESGRHAASAIIYSMLKRAPKSGSAGRSRGGLVGDFPQIWNLEDHEPADLKYFTELDEALCKDNLPHILDILSVTRLVEALLEVDLSEEQIRAFQKTFTGIIDALKKPVNLGILAGRQALGAYRGLTEGILNSVAGHDQLSRAVREILTRPMRDLDDYYKAIWPSRSG